MFDGHEITLTNLDKVMYPETGTTKGEVIDYYRSVAPWFVAHNGRRPATRKRWVDGVGTAATPGKAFFTKNLDSGTPDWVDTVTLTHREREAAYPLIDDAATLVWLAQLAALEIHVPQWRIGPRGGRHNPDRFVLDLDPGEGAGLVECVRVALLCKQILDGMGLASVPVTSGSKGIHLYAALDGGTTSAQAATVARELARALAAEHKDLVVADMKRAIRGGRVFIDWSQNDGSKTTVAPYSLRGRAQPYAAAPRSWDELTEDLRQLSYAEVLWRLHTVGDLLAPLLPPPEDRPAPSLPESAPDLPRIAPMLATLGTAEDLVGREWAYETKWDGYRAIAEVAGGRAILRTRNGIDVSGTYAELQELATVLGQHAAVLDGEIVALDASGRSNFGRLQNRSDKSASVTAHYMIFDVLHLDGRSLLRTPYAARREILADLDIAGRHVHVPVTFGTDQELALRTSRELQLEGVIAKTTDGIYLPGGRARTWIKIKNLRTQEVIVAGWTPGAGRRDGTIGSLILAVTGSGGLVYAGRVGTGFTENALRQVQAKLAALERTTPTLSDVPRADAKDAHWVTPSLVGEVAFTEWTDTGRLRHPAWRGWRPDKDPGDVARGEG